MFCSQEMRQKVENAFCLYVFVYFTKNLFSYIGNFIDKLFESFIN